MTRVLYYFALMKISSLFPMCSLAFVFAVACGGNEGPANQDPISSPPRDVDPLPGGGTSGGPIAEVVTVFVEDASGTPVEGATIILELAGGRLVAESDSEGRADFSDDAIKGAVNVHVFHRDHRYTSIIGVDASVITAHLERADDRAVPALTVASASGRVTGWDLLAPNTTDRSRVAEVIAVGDVAEVAQEPRPGTVTPGNADGTDWNLVVNGDSPFPAWTDYRLMLDARTQTLAVFAGTFTVGETPVLEYTHLGLRTGMNIEANEALNYQDVAITHALDRRVEVIATNVPHLATREVHFGLELDGSSERITLSTIALEDGAAAVAHAPALTDALASARYSAIIEAREGERQVIARMSDTVSTFTFAPMLAPVGDPTAAGRSLAAQPSAGATLHVYTLRDDAKNRTVWTAIVAGDAQRSIELPAMPEGLVDPLVGRLSLTVSAYDLLDADPNALSFSNMETAARSIARSHATVDL